MTVRCPHSRVAGPTYTSVPAFVARGAPPRLNVICAFLLSLACHTGSRRRLGAVEQGSHLLQVALYPFRERMRAAEHAPRCPFQILEHLHAFAEIIARGAGVIAECYRVSPPNLERELISSRR